MAPGAQSLASACRDMADFDMHVSWGDRPGADNCSMKGLLQPIDSELHSCTPHTTLARLHIGGRRIGDHGAIVIQ